MAKKWIVYEAVKALEDGDPRARIDIGHRFPLFATMTEREILGFVRMSVRQIEIMAKQALESQGIPYKGYRDEDVKEKLKKEKSKKVEKKVVKKVEKKKSKSKVEEEDEEFGEADEDEDSEDLEDEKPFE